MIWQVRQVDEADDAVLANEADVINKIVAANEAILIGAANEAIVNNEPTRPLWPTRPMILMMMPIGLTSVQPTRPL